MNTSDTGMKGVGHGAGTLDTESILSARQDYIYRSATATYTDTSERLIKLQESTQAVYAPATIKFGKSLSFGPLRSLLSDATSVSNPGIGVDMSAEFRYADKLNSDVTAAAYLKDSEPDYDEPVQIHDKIGYSELSFQSDFQGQANIGVVTPVKNSQGSQMLIDESYLGAYTISKKMRIDVNCQKETVEADWLPCCTAGWYAMNPGGRKGFGASTNGIFNCNCYKVPERAEFQR